MAKEKLAINGGEPVRKGGFPSGNKVGKEELKELIDVIDCGNMFYASGTKVKGFAQEFAAIHGAKHAVTSTSGTAALHVAIAMVNPSPGDEIIVGPITDIGSIIGIVFQTAIPVFCEVRPDTFNMDPKDIERKITDKTKAIMAIHLFGNPCDMDPIMKIAKKHKLLVIEDCSQAHMSEYKGKFVGTMGHIGCFSLQQSKHITAGDGGITITNDDDLGARGALFMDKGWHRGEPGARKYTVFGINYRMNELTGAVALAQVRKMKNVVALRRARGDLLSELIADNPHVQPQKLLDGCKHTYWQYGLRVLDDAPFTPADFAKALKAEGIGCGQGYIGKPIFLCHEALRTQTIFGDSKFPFDHPNTRKGIAYDEATCPITQKVLDRMVTASVSQFLSESDIRDMAEGINKVSRLLKK
ncbi:MAG: DegT/DnrJ/EryC1/StrS family aminotransferase [Planctomycetota bacterium]